MVVENLAILVPRRTNKYIVFTMCISPTNGGTFFIGSVSTKYCDIDSLFLL